MAWTAYQVVFRVRTPLHIGDAKMGNVHYTRRYVTGRAVWGALTERVTRDEAARTGNAAVNYHAYKIKSETIHQRLGYTYFYLAERRDAEFDIVWPWEDRRIAPYLKSYVSTALDGLAGSAKKGSLHETEMIVPQRSADSGPTHLLGYFFEHHHTDPSRVQAPPAWKEALHRLQFGADRSYGWGWVEVAQGPTKIDGSSLFGGAAQFDGSGDRPRITVRQGSRLLAHTKTSDVPVAGKVEPFVGREVSMEDFHYAGQRVNYQSMCFAPGGTLQQEKTFAVEEFGVWEAESN